MKKHQEVAGPLFVVLVLLVFSSCGGETGSDKVNVDPDTAQQELEKNPTANGYIDLSLTFYRAGMYEKCIQASENALDLDPANVLAYNNICAANNSLRRWDRAISACEKALALSPGYELAQNNLTVARNGKAGR